MAPWNNNQFLLEDHGVETPSFLRSPASEPIARLDSLSEEDFFESGSEEGEFLTRNFAQMYNQLHAESLSSLRHSDLVARCLELEDEVAALGKQAAELRAQACNSDRQVMEQLRAENDSLKSENNRLLGKELSLERSDTTSISEE